MTRNKYLAFGAVFCICLFHVLAEMGYLVSEGRLALVPLYDDVTYLVDGMVRFAVLSRTGIGGFLADLYAHPAHAPFMAVTSAFGFLLSGGAIWGAYVLNSLWVFLAAGLALLVVRDVGLKSRVGIVVALLAVPLFGHAVVEFRPDPVWGLLVGLSAALLVTADIARTHWSRLLMLGLLIGAAVISKPTAAPASVAVIFAVYLGQGASSFVLQPFVSRRALLRGAMVMALGAAVVVIPYVIVSGAEVLAYILMVMHDTKSVWRTKATTVGHITFYLNRGLGFMMLGWVWYAALPILLLCLGLLIRAKDRRGLCAFIGILCGLAVAYLIVTVSTVKSHMIGSILYGAIIGAMAWSLGQIVRHLPIRNSIVLLVGVLIFLTQWVPQKGMVQRADPAMQTTDQASRAAFPVVLEALRTHTNKNVLVTAPGPVFSATLDFMARQQGVVGTFHESYVWDQWQLFVQGVYSCDIIVLAEAGMLGQSQSYNFPSLQFQARLLQYLRDSQAFSEQAVYTDERGKSVWVFVRQQGKAEGGLIGR